MWYLVLQLRNWLQCKLNVGKAETRRTWWYAQHTPHLIDSVEMPPPTQFKELVEYHFEKKLEFLVGSDASVHCTGWGQLRLNPRGESLYEYLMGQGLLLPKHKSINDYYEGETRGLGCYNKQYRSTEADQCLESI